MIQECKLWAIIPARSGSKRIINKNTYNFCGQPLISWTIQNAKKSKFIDEVFVSTDDIKIADIAKNYGAKVPFIRPKKLSQDKSNTVDVLNHAIKKLKLNKKDFIILLQPTSPLRNYKDIEKAINIILTKKNVENIVSVNQINHPLEWTNILPRNNSMKNFISKENLNKRSQDFPLRYQINGAIFIVKIESFLKKQKFIFEQNSFACSMPYNRSIDIDHLDDLKLAEYYFKKIN